MRRVFRERIARGARLGMKQLLLWIRLDKPMVAAIDRRMVMMVLFNGVDYFFG